ncbi:MAG TPA: dihydrofolate reductase [Devosia sp.]|nr:dihydrofolate reductase [Devosia sp.]
MSVRLAMIAAVAENGVIGAGSRIPWRIPSDMAHFKRVTMGKPIIMGRRQFEIFNRPLPGRTNLVVSRQPGYQPEGVIVINDLMAAIDHAKTIAEAEGADEAVVIGGGEIYAEAMPLADRLYISHVALRPEGDVFFPAIDPAVWKVVAEPAVEPSPKDEAGYAVRVYERR